jgi:hypothetical protein
MKLCMPRTRKFSPPITLRDGRVLKTLRDARLLILALPEMHQRDAHWRYATELLLVAADKKEKYTTMDARSQLIRALKAEGLI